MIIYLVARVWLSSFRLINEKSLGLISVFKFQCNMCRLVHFECYKELQQVNLNKAATTSLLLLSEKKEKKLLNDVYTK